MIGILFHMLTFFGPWFFSNMEFFHINSHVSSLIFFVNFLFVSTVTVGGFYQRTFPQSTP